MTWFVYMIENNQGQWYTGITTDVNRRFQQHSEGKGAKALRGKGPLKLLFQGEVESRSYASRIEIKIKKLDKHKKAMIVKGSLCIHSLL